MTALGSGAGATLRSTLIGLLCLGANACGGAAYAVPPEQAAQRNDADWNIKRVPPSGSPVAEAAPEAQDLPTATPKVEAAP